MITALIIIVIYKMNGSIFLTAIQKNDTSPLIVSNGPISQETQDTTNKLLSSVDYEIGSKKSYTSKGITYNIMIDGDTCYLCVSDDTMQRRICFAFLERLKTSTNLNKKFIKDEMDFFSKDPQADKIRQVTLQVDQIKDIMLENIDKILTRGEKLEDIDGKAEDLQNQSRLFSKTSKTLKCQLIQQNMCLTITIISIIVMILLIVAIMIWQFTK